MDPITLAIFGIGALGLGYWAFVKKGLAGTPTTTAVTASKAAPVVTAATANPNSPLTALQQMVNAVPLDGSGNYIHTGAASEQLNAILSYMKQNPSSHALMPASVATWIVNHNIDAARTGQ